MDKIKVRCVKGFGIVGHSHNIEVIAPLAGFGYSKKLYICDCCGEILVYDLDNPDLIGSSELLGHLGGNCPICQAPLKEHLLPYPDYVFFSGSVRKMDPSTISYDRDSSSVEELWEISQRSEN